MCLFAVILKGDLPVLQFELIRNIHFQSLASSSWSLLALPGKGLTSLPSCLPTKPRPPLSLPLQYSLKYSFFHSYTPVTVVVIEQFSFWSTYIGLIERTAMYLIVERKPRPVLACCLDPAQVLVGEMREYDEDNLVPELIERRWRLGVGCGGGMVTMWPFGRRLYTR